MEGNKIRSTVNSGLLFLLMLFTAGCGVYKNARFESHSEISLNSALTYKKNLYLHSNNGTVFTAYIQEIRNDSLFVNLVLNKEIHASCENRLVIKKRKHEYMKHLHFYGKSYHTFNEGFNGIALKEIDKMIVHERTFAVPILVWGGVIGMVVSVINGISFSFTI